MTEYSEKKYEYLINMNENWQTCNSGFSYLIKTFVILLIMISSDLIGCPSGS